MRRASWWRRRPPTSTARRASSCATCSSTRSPWRASLGSWSRCRPICGRSPSWWWGTNLGGGNLRIAASTKVQGLMLIGGYCKPMPPQARERTMPKNPVTTFEVSPEMRDFAEQSVEEARKAFENFISAARKTTAYLDSQAAGAKDLGDKTMTFAEENIATAFQFAQKLVRAENIQEVIELQSEFVKTQMPTFIEQAKALGQTAAKGSTSAT